MSSKSVNQQMITGALKSPYAFLVYLGAFIWYASGMTPEQLRNLKALLEVLETPAGYALLFFVGLVLFYGLFFFPVGHFLGKHVSMAFSGIQTHYKSHDDAVRRAEEHYKDEAEHHRETKILNENMQKMACSIQKLSDNCRIIVDKFEP